MIPNYKMGFVHIYVHYCEVLDNYLTIYIDLYIMITRTITGMPTLFLSIQVFK